MALPEKLLKNYEKFQVNFSKKNLISTVLCKNYIHLIFKAKNNIPVYLKGGPMDKVLFGITVAGCALGILGMVHMVYTMGFAKKQ